MSFAGDLTLVEVRDSWLKADGSPEAGTITFTPSVKFRNVTSGQQIAPTTVTKALDVNGQISVLLPAVDDLDYDPTQWTYRVTVQLDGGYSDSYVISLPSSAAGTGVDLGLMTAVSTSGGVYRPAPDPILPLIFGRLAWLFS